MKFKRLVPPVTLCHRAAIFDRPQDDRPDRFIDVGCGQGSFAAKLISRGWRRIGVDFSPDSIATVRPDLEPEMTADRMKAIQGDVLHLQMGRRPVPA
jgi:ubiquinone/menaquinone biosynthesis C-methylase UbiE